MELVNATKMAAGYTTGMEPDGRESIIVVVKGTYAIPDGVSEQLKLAKEQIPLVMADEFSGEPGFSAPVYEAEFPLVKRRCDVLLKVGHLRTVRSIGGRAYAAGMDRQVYRRLGPGNWQALDNGLPPGGEDDIAGFEAIDGFAEDDLYAVSREGEIWHYDGEMWQQLDSPTNLILTGVTCAPDGQVYICGQAGLLIR